MGALVTLIAALELAQHLGIVRCAMTVLTLGNHRMLVDMAEDAQESRVLGRPGFQLGPDVIMTGTAVDVLNVISVRQRPRLMDLVAHDAVGEFLLFKVRLVTVEAVRLVAMLVMAE